MKKIIYDITPTPAPRQVRSSKWNPSRGVLNYWAFKDECRLKGVAVPESGAHITFVLPMPRSWSERKKAEMDGQPHQQKPDTDNLVKALLDAIYSDDAHIWDYRISKKWGYNGLIQIDINK